MRTVPGHGWMSNLRHDPQVKVGDDPARDSERHVALYTPSTRRQRRHVKYNKLGTLALPCAAKSSSIRKSGTVAALLASSDLVDLDQSLFRIIRCSPA